MEKENKILAKYKRDKGYIVIYRTVSRPLRIATRLLYDPDTETHIHKKRIFKGGKKQ